ncbi:gamma-glutamyltransferase [Hydrogenophaga soli]
MPLSRRTFTTPLALLVCLALAGCASLHGSPPAGVAAPLPAATFTPPEPPSGYTPKTVAFAARDMVAAAHPLAVQAGLDMLAQGGSAVDAAIAVQMAQGVVEPQSSGIGGGAFLLHFDPAHPAAPVQAWDGRETAPAAATPDQFLAPDGQPLPFTHAVDGGLSVGVPGVLRMLEAAHRQHGRLPWATLFQPAIRLAEQGFAVSPRLHAVVASVAERMRAQAALGHASGVAMARQFLDAQGQPKAVGTRLTHPALADTLRRVAAGGADAFYRGDIAADLVAAVRNHPTRPGRLTLADVAGYQEKLRSPACFTYKVRYQMCGMPPPSSGGIAVGQILGLLERLPVPAQANAADWTPTHPTALHLLTEAHRLAYADRARYLADPDFVPVPTAGLLDPAYLIARAALIRPDRTLGSPAAGQPPGAPLALGLDASPELPSTSHVAVVDRQGRAVSMTTTVESAFGSLQLVRGFVLNNQLTDFSFVPADASGPVANRVEPGKRPRSSMAPTVVLNARTVELEAVLGSPGGSAIIQYVARALLGLTDWGLDVQQAVEQPHVGAQVGPVTLVEKGSVIDTAAVHNALAARGHQPQATPAFTSGLHGIVFNGQRADGSWGLFARHPGQGTWAGGADPRREGVAAGH